MLLQQRDDLKLLNGRPDLIDLQFWSEVGIDLFQQVYCTVGNVIISLNYHLFKGKYVL